jgi:hypothetical protein
MSTGISPSSLDIFLQLSLPKFDRNRWVNNTQAYRRLEFFSRFMSQKKVPEEGGESLAWKVQVSAVNNTRLTQLYDRDTTQIANNMKEAKVNWAMATTSYAYDVREEGLQGDNKTKILSHIAVKESEMYMKWAESWEQWMWTCPAADADPAPFYGLPYWLTPSATQGFNGTVPTSPTGYTTIANLNPTTYNVHRNWTDVYADLTRDDLVEKVMLALHATNFQAAPNVQWVGTEKPMWQMFGRYTTIAALKKLQELRNENLGPDVGWMQGELVIKGVPLVVADALDGGRFFDSTLQGYDSTYPIYGVDFSPDGFSFRYKTGQHAVRSGPIKGGPDEHNNRYVFMDSTGQFKYRNRAKGFRLYQA